MTHLISKKDLNYIISCSKDKMQQLNLPLFVSNSEIDHSHLPTMANLEATLMYLNSKNLLTTTVGIDYTSEYGDNDMPDLVERE